MTPRAIAIRLAEPGDAQAVATMSRDFIESGLGWKYDAARVQRAIRDRETLAVVACESGKSNDGRGAIIGFAIMELELRSGNDAARRFYRAMGFYETVLVPGYYRGGEGRKEGALRMLRVLRTPGPAPFTWRPPKTEDT